MSKKSTYLLGIFLTIVLGTVLYWYLCCANCCNKQSCDTDKNKQDTPTKVSENTVNQSPTFFPFQIKDENGKQLITVDESINFKKSNFTILDSVSEGINSGIVGIKKYLDDNGDKRFNITGYYTADETNNSAFPNLGLARANSIKNHMVSQGVSSKVINIFGELKEDMVADENNIFKGPLNFTVFTETEETAAQEEALKATCDAIKENPLMLYFETGAAAISLTPEQREKFANMAQCVDKLDLKIQVVGHTDNTGSANANMALGQKRADFVKNYLVNNGILQENIQTSSKGQNQPIADNATEEGRAKNRRIEVTIN